MPRQNNALEVFQRAFLLGAKGEQPPNESTPATVSTMRSALIAAAFMLLRANAFHLLASRYTKRMALNSVSAADVLARLGRMTYCFRSVLNSL
jgi:hypothetical protein